MMADHSAGTAVTLIRPGQYVLTVEFKVSLLRPARLERLRCRAVVEPGVYPQKLVSKATVTVAVLGKP